MRVIITGVTGFVGSHLADYLTSQHPDVAVYGTYRWRSRMENLEDLAPTHPPYPPHADHAAPPAPTTVIAGSRVVIIQGGVLQ